MKNYWHNDDFLQIEMKLNTPICFHYETDDDIDHELKVFSKPPYFLFLMMFIITCAANYCFDSILWKLRWLFKELEYFCWYILELSLKFSCIITQGSKSHSNTPTSTMSLMASPLKSHLPRSIVQPSTGQSAAPSSNRAPRHAHHWPFVLWWWPQVIQQRHVWVLQNMPPWYPTRQPYSDRIRAY